MSPQLSLIESAIDVPLMDTKNISKLIDEYTVEYSSDEEPTAFFFFRDCMRVLYAKSLNNIPEDGLKSALVDCSAEFNGYDIWFLHPMVNDFKNMLTKTTSNLQLRK